MKVNILNELNYSPTQKDLEELRHKQSGFWQCDKCPDWFDSANDLNYEGYCNNCVRKNALTKWGECPKCNHEVDYEGTFNYEASAFKCNCPECNWQGWENYEITFTEMTDK